MKVEVINNYIEIEFENYDEQSKLIGELIHSKIGFSGTAINRIRLSKNIIFDEYVNHVKKVL